MKIISLVFVLCCFTCLGQTKGDGAKALLGIKTFEDVVQDFSALNRQQVLKMKALPNYGLVAIPLRPIKNKLWWEQKGLIGENITLPKPYLEYDIERKLTLTSPWTLFARTNRPPVVLIPSGYYRVGGHYK